VRKILEKRQFEYKKIESHRESSLQGVCLHSNTGGFSMEKNVGMCSLDSWHQEKRDFFLGPSETSDIFAHPTSELTLTFIL